MLGLGLGLPASAIRGGSSGPSLDLDFMGGQLDDRITFARASTATRYNAAGLLETVAAGVARFDHDPVAVTNLFKQSGDLSAGGSWGSSGGVTAALGTEAAPDGVGKWSVLTSPGVSSDRRQSVPAIASARYTASIYAKRGNQPLVSMQLHITGGTTVIRGVSYNFDTDTFATVGGVGGGVVRLGGGVVRLTVTATDDGDGTLAYMLAHTFGTGSAYAAGSTGLYWGAQMELNAAAAGLYVPTTTAAASYYEPRGLLVEEARTNLAPGTMTGGTHWNTVGAGTSTASGAAAPDGTSNGVTITEGGTVSAYGLNLGSPLPTITASAPTTCSVFAKAGTCTWLRMLLVDGLTPTVSAQAWFNLTTGAVGTINVFTSTGGTPTAISADMQSAGAGYWRCSLTATLATATTGGIMLRMVSADGVTSDTGGKTMSFFGPQLEVGAFATSWIPTTTAAATRAGEVATMGSTAAWYNAPEGTLYSEFAATKIPPPATQYPVALDDGTVSNLLTVYVDGASQIIAYMQTNSIGQMSPLLIAGATSGTVYRTALAYRTNDSAASANGGAAVVDTLNTLGTYNRLIIGNRADGIRQFSGHVRRVRFWRSRRSNAELQAITA